MSQRDVVTRGNNKLNYELLLHELIRIEQIKERNDTGAVKLQALDAPTAIRHNFCIN